MSVLAGSRPVRSSGASRVRSSGARFRADVEGLRGVAVVAVVCYHAGLGLTSGGYVGVDVFFVISGFLITRLLWNEVDATGLVSFAAFYGRRVRRLLPAAGLVLIATVVASAVALSPLQARDVIKDAQASALYVANYRFAALRTNYLAAQTPSPIQHYWSLAVEEQFYLLWPLLLMLGAAVLPNRLRTNARATVALLLGVLGSFSFALSLYLTRVSEPWAFFSLPTRAWELAAGAGIALAAPAIARMPKIAAALVGWAGIGAIAWAVTRFTSATPFPGTSALVPVAGAALVLAAGCAAPSRGASIALASSPLQRAGRISYSWYLWHWPVLILVPAMIGHSFNLAENLALVGFSAGLATATVALVERPVRFAPRLATQPRVSLALGGTITVATVVTIAVVATTLAPLHGASPVAAPGSLASGGAQAAGASTVAPGGGSAGNAATPSLGRRLAVAYSPLETEVARGVATRGVPSNLEPSLGGAHGDEALPFLDGCNATYSVTTVHRCAYAATQSSTSVMLFGDSHASQWFPALDTVANRRNWRLVVLDKSTCPPLELTVFSPVLDRTYTECSQFRQSSLARIRAERPKVVILGVARHYSTAYHFSVYGSEWISGLASMVREIRALGPRVVVMGPTPKPNLPDVPDCLSAHLFDAAACTTPTNVAVNMAGMNAERVAVVNAGGSYVDVVPWVCTNASCAVTVGNLLVYRDDNHLTTKYVSWLTPVFETALDAALNSNQGVSIAPS